MNKINEVSSAKARRDPDVVFSFLVEIDGISCASFIEAHGLEYKAEPVSFHEGGNPRHKVNLIGPGSFMPLVLKKGFFAHSGEFFEWMNNTMNSQDQKVQRATISVVLRSADGEETGRYNIFGAFITRYSGPSFNATDSSIAVEEVEIAYDNFEYESADKR